MVKVVQCVTRKPGMDAADFRTHWMNYGNRLESMIHDRPNVLRFRLTTTLLVKETVNFMIRYGTAAPFDGMIEMWLEDANITATNLRGDKATQTALEELGTLLREFTDPEKSTVFFAAEDLVFDREAALVQDA